MAAKKTTSHLNPIESLSDVSHSIGTNTIDSLANLGSGMLDQLLGITHADLGRLNRRSENSLKHKKTKQKKSSKKKPISLTIRVIMKM